MQQVYVRFCLSCGCREGSQYINEESCEEIGRGPCVFPPTEPFNPYSLNHRSNTVIFVDTEMPPPPEDNTVIYVDETAQTGPDYSRLSALPGYPEISYHRIFAYLDQNDDVDRKQFQALNARAFLLPLQCITYGLVEGPLGFHCIHNTLLKGEIQELPFGLSSIVERMMAQLFINCATSIIGIPEEHNLRGRIHRHSSESWWCRIGVSPIPQLPLRDNLYTCPMPDDPQPRIQHIRLYSAQGNCYDLERQACWKSTMLRYFMRRHDAKSVVLPTINASTLELIIMYLRHYAIIDPPEIQLPIMNNFLGSCGALLWDIQFVHMTWTNLFDLLLAANLMGIVPLVDLICAKISIAIKYPTAEDGYPYDNICAVTWPEVIHDLTNVFEACAQFERNHSPDTVEPKKGDLVRIQHLTGKQAASLNGQLAEVLYPISRSDRLGVSVISSMDRPGEKKISIKKSNLVVIQLTPKYLINRAMAWYLGWFMEFPFADSSHFG